LELAAPLNVPPRGNGELTRYRDGRRMILASGGRGAGSGGLESASVGSRFSVLARLTSLQGINLSAEGLDFGEPPLDVGDEPPDIFPTLADLGNNFLKRRPLTPRIAGHGRGDGKRRANSGGAARGLPASSASCTAVTRLRQLCRRPAFWRSVVLRTRLLGSHPIDWAARHSWAKPAGRSCYGAPWAGAVRPRALEFDLRRLLDGQVAGPGTPENLVHVGRGVPK
jgi:hypothetical protein